MTMMPAGNGFDITTAYYLKGEECKAFARTNTGDTYKTIYLSFRMETHRPSKKMHFPPRVS